MPVDKDFEKILEGALRISPYAAEIRYPGALDEEISLERAEEAVRICRNIRKFIRSKLSLRKI